MSSIAYISAAILSPAIEGVDVGRRGLIMNFADQENLMRYIMVRGRRSGMARASLPMICGAAEIFAGRYEGLAMGDEAPCPIVASSERKAICRSSH